MNLFKVIRTGTPICDEFKTILEDPYYQPVHKVLQGWGEGLLERVGEQRKFIVEFQTTFNSSFWELYLNKVFMELGYSVDYTKDRPDFCITTPEGHEFNVEAVISDRSKVLTKDEEEMDEETYVQHSTIKLIGKLKDKKDLFTGSEKKKNSYSSLEHVKGKPFVIAIAPFDSKMSLSQNNTMINRVLFGIEVPDMNDFTVGKQRTVNSIFKPNDAKIEVGIFTNDSYKEISAIIFSTTGTLGKAMIESGTGRLVRSTRFKTMGMNEFISKEGMKNKGRQVHRLSRYNYLITNRMLNGDLVFGSDTSVCHSSDWTETHLDGLHIYYNPFATTPLDPKIFKAKEITHNFYDIDRQEPDMQHPDGALVSRQVYEPSKQYLDFLVATNCPEFITDIKW
ncbi:hypothetical protein LLR08_21615 [Rouxiella badensis]|uniref:hypothetical protein n=1 Tax=Rouxiella badensis TaxID=1646377 RepID=UPI001D15752A|nr:hypothetical protein [Rouxiella badensis]MCC3705152.1 hypothetical protein [Rouxiella badensis]